MSRLPSSLNPPIAFADGGARAHEPRDTPDAFALALRLGATGLASELWLTADGVLVLSHSPTHKPGRFRHIAWSETQSLDLDDEVAHLDATIGQCRAGQHVLVRLGDRAALEPLLDLVAALDRSWEQRLWVADTDIELLAKWTDAYPNVQFVHETRLDRLRSTPERHAAELAERSITALLMPYADWTGGLGVLLHRFGVLGFADGAKFDRMLDDALRMGVDGVATSNAELVTDAYTRANIALEVPSV